MKAPAVLCLALLATAVRAQAPLTAKGVYDRCRDSVVSIETENPQGGRAGTGFFFGDGKTVVTCFHVVANATSILIRDAKGVAWRPESLAFDASADVAVLRLWQDSGHRSLPYAPPETVHIGDPVFAIGDPLGLTATLSEGIVSAFREDEGVRYVQFTAAISHGNSGGPVLDGNGRVLGVVALLSEKGQNLNFAVGAEVAKRLTISAKDVKVGDYYALAKASPESDAAPKPEGAAPKAEAEPPKEEVGEDEARRRDEAKTRGAFADVYGDVVVAVARWDATWGTGLNQTRRIAIRNLGECRRRFAAAVKRRDDLESLLAACPRAAVSVDREALFDSLAALGRIGDALYDAQSECIVASAKKGKRFTQAQETWRVQLDRLDQELLEFRRRIRHPAWANDEAFSDALSPVVWSVLLLNRFDAIPDLDLTSATVGWPYGSSSLKTEDRISGIRRTGDAEFTPVDDWAAVKAFYLANGDKPGGFELRVVRDGKERFVDESPRKKKEQPDPPGRRGEAGAHRRTSAGTQSR